MVSTRSIYLNIYTVPSLGQWLIDLGWDLWFLILGKSWPNSSVPFLSGNSKNRLLATNLPLADWASNSQNKNVQILRDNKFTPPNKPRAKLMEAYLPENYHINSKVVGNIKFLFHVESNSIYLFDRKNPNEDLWSKNDAHEACLSEMRLGAIFSRSQIVSLCFWKYIRVRY